MKSVRGFYSAEMDRRFRVEQQKANWKTMNEMDDRSPAMSESTRDCEHGSRRRSCEICYRDQEIARLRSLVASTQERCAQVAFYYQAPWMTTEGRRVRSDIASAIRAIKMETGHE